MPERRLAFDTIWAREAHYNTPGLQLYVNMRFRECVEAELVSDEAWCNQMHQIGALFA